MFFVIFQEVKEARSRFAGERIFPLMERNFPLG